MLIEICTEPLPSLQKAAPWVPSDVDAWFQKACARNPEDRFSSADEMMKALVGAAGANAGRLSITDVSVHTLIGSSLGQERSSAPTLPGAQGSESGQPPQALAQQLNELSSSSISSAGAASVTVNVPPERRSRLAWGLGAGLLALGGAGVFWLGDSATPGSGEEETPLVAQPAIDSAATPEPSELSNDANATATDADGADEAPEGANPDAHPVEAVAPQPPSTAAQSAAPSAPPARPRAAAPQRAAPKSAPVKTQAPPKSPAAPAPSSPAPKPSRPAVPDLGF